jgi:O-antigen/teichoic acid export membrane protein
MIAAGTNIVMNLILIPTVGFMGAAYSSMISFGVGAIALYIVLQRVYPIRYEYRRLGILAISVITLYGMYLLARFEDIDSIPIRLVLLVCWPLLLFILKFFSMEELARIKAFVRRR